MVSARKVRSQIDEELDITLETIKTTPCNTVIHKKIWQYICDYSKKPI